MTLTVDESNIIYAILRETEQKICERTGKYVELTISYRIDEHNNKPADMLRVIARSLGRNSSDYENPSRKTEFVMLRRIGAYFVRHHYPSLRLKEIGSLFGQDHTTIINSLAAAKASIATDDEAFMSLFAVAQQAVSDWINQ